MLEAAIEEPLGDVRYWYVRRDDDGRRRCASCKRVRFFLMRHRGGRFADRDDEMDDVRWFPLGRAEAAVAYANERDLVRKARERLAPGGAKSGGSE